MDLQCEIAHCRNVRAWFTDPKKPNPCSRIIESQGLPQNAEALERFQLPEPWQGHLDRALILFVSSNPSIDPRIIKFDPLQVTRGKGSTQRIRYMCTTLPKTRRRDVAGVP
jgi:hypothetical protein